VKLSFLVPFRDVDGTRTRARDWILLRWQHFYPDAEIIVASDDGIDPFNKSLAVNRAAREATGDVFAILDADSWVEPKWITLAFEQLERGVYKWVIPARRSYRLTRSASDRILALPPTADFKVNNSREEVEQSGAVVGFLHIVPREGFEMVGGMDARFRGWGGEDSCFVRALDVVYGPHIQLPGQVFSLWHSRPRGGPHVKGRYWEGQAAEHYAVRHALGQRYGMARTRPQMLELLGR
jgi:glycosyltransferase involved in cell wall biosynthesis